MLDNLLVSLSNYGTQEYLIFFGLSLKQRITTNIKVEFPGQ